MGYVIKEYRTSLTEEKPKEPSKKPQNPWEGDAFLRAKIIEKVQKPKEKPKEDNKEET